MDGWMWSLSLRTIRWHHLLPLPHTCSQGNGSMGPRSSTWLGCEAALLAVYLRNSWNVSSTQVVLPVLFTAVSPGTGQVLITYLLSESC